MTRVSSHVNTATTRIGVDLFILNRAMEERAHRAAVAGGATGLTMAQALLLARVDPHGTRLGELAARALVTKQSAGHLVDQLERAGYVERLVEPADRRARLVCLTERARATIPAADAEVRAVLAEWESVLGPELMGQLATALSRLAAISDPFAP